MAPTLQYQPIVGRQGGEAGSSHGPGYDWVTGLFPQQDYIGRSQIPTQPVPTQEDRTTDAAEDTPPHWLRTNPRPHEQFTFPSDHMPPPRLKRGRGTRRDD